MLPGYEYRLLADIGGLSTSTFISGLDGLGHSKCYSARGLTPSPSNIHSSRHLINNHPHSTYIGRRFYKFCKVDLRLVGELERYCRRRLRFKHAVSIPFSRNTVVELISWTNPDVNRSYNYHDENTAHPEHTDHGVAGDLSRVLRELTVYGNQMNLTDHQV